MRKLQTALLIFTILMGYFVLLAGYEQGSLSPPSGWNMLNPLAYISYGAGEATFGWAGNHVTPTINLTTYNVPDGRFGTYPLVLLEWEAISIILGAVLLILGHYSKGTARTVALIHAAAFIGLPISDYFLEWPFR